MKGLLTWRERVIEVMSVVDGALCGSVRNADCAAFSDFAEMFRTAQCAT